MDDHDENPFCLQRYFHKNKYTYTVKERVGGSENIPFHVAQRTTKTKGQTERKAEIQLESDPESGNEKKLVFIKFAFFKDSIVQLQHEYHTSLGIHHDDLLGVEESFVSKGRLCVLIQYMGNKTLRSVIDLIHPTGLPETHVVVALRSVVSAVNTLHASDILHKKITAENVLVNTTYPIGPLELEAQFDIKLAYSASLFDYKNEPFAEMSDSSFTYKSDILSIGITTLQLCYGIEFWEKNEEGLKNMVRYIRNMKRLPPKKHDHKVTSKMDRLITTIKTGGADTKDFSNKLEKFVLHCLAENPINRPTAQQLLAHDIFGT